MNNTLHRFKSFFASATAASLASVWAAALAILPASYAMAAGKLQKVGMFDLRYTLNYSLKDSLKTLAAWDDCHAVATLQGVVNRDAPRLFINYIVAFGTNTDEYWWNKYRAGGEWLDGAEVVNHSTIEELVTAYRQYIKGAVVYDSGVASTSNIASAVAGAEDLIALRYDTRRGSLYSRLVLSGPKLPVKVWLVGQDGSPLFTGKGMIPGTSVRSTGSVKCDPYVWLMENYMKKGLLSSDYGGYYIDQKWREQPTKSSSKNHHTLTNHDFFVSKRAFFFDFSPWGDEAATDDPSQPVGTDLETFKQMLLLTYNKNGGRKFCHIGGFVPWAFKYTTHNGGKHEDVPTEWELTRVIGSYNAYVDADALGLGAMANASFWQHFPLEEKYPQSWISREELRKRGYLTSDGKVDFKGRQFIIFYVGCYDSAAWLSQRTPSIWDDPRRGDLPMMWCISPVLEKRAPHVMHYYRRSASPKDYFAASDNGAGYLMPGVLQAPRERSGLPDGVAAWGEHCKPYFDKWGLTITGFVINAGAPAMNRNSLDCYESFSYNGIVVQGSETPLTLLHGKMPVMRHGITVGSKGQKDIPQVADALAASVRSRQPMPFHWFRAILKSPAWHIEVMEQLHKKNPSVELLDAPTFFELYRIWLEDNPNAARGEFKTGGRK